MIQLPAGLVRVRFEWDPKKAATNLRKHNVAFQEAATIFSDPLAITFVGPDHSTSENRYVTSARLMDRKERRIYEEV